MPDYDSLFFEPPAPLAYTTLINPQNNLEQTSVPMLLDTGADISLVPEAFVEKLCINAASIQTKALLAGFDDTKSLSRSVELHLVFAGLTFRGNYFLIKQDYGIIGRNILNLLNINFDGRNSRWEIL